MFVVENNNYKFYKLKIVNKLVWVVIINLNSLILIKNGAFLLLNRKLQKLIIDTYKCYHLIKLELSLNQLN